MTSDEKQTRNNRLVLLSIAGLPVTMILMATWLWYYVADGNLDLVGTLGTANRGHLVQPPRRIDDIAMFGSQGPVKYADLPPKWTMVIAHTGPDCGVVCEHTLYITRQIHTAIGKDYNRIARLYLSETAPGDTRLAVDTLSDGRSVPVSFAALLAKEHNDLHALALAPGGGEALFPELDADPTTWYLVDPAGWIMMSYNSEIGYKDVISDLKFLLKNSSS